VRCPACQCDVSPKDGLCPVCDKQLTEPMSGQPRATPRTDEAKRLLERLHWDVSKVPFCRILASLEQSETESDARAEENTRWQNEIQHLRNTAEFREERITELERKACEFYITPEKIMVMASPEAVQQARRDAAAKTISLESENAKLAERIAELEAEVAKTNKWRERLKSDLHRSRNDLANANEYSRELLAENAKLREALDNSAENALLKWLDENAAELVAESYPIADTGDYSGAWVVYQHEGYPGGTPKRIAMGWGETPADAIKDAQRGPDDPDEMDYVPPEHREGIQALAGKEEGQ
jgi:hypothetical protein